MTALPPLVSLKTLQANLQELTSLEAGKEVSSPHIVANYCGKRVYNSSYGWGRLWTIFYSIADLFSKKTRETRLERALRLTNSLYEKNLVAIRAYHTQYLSNLNEPSNASEKQAAKKLRLTAALGITKFNKAIFPLIGKVAELPYAQGVHLERAQAILRHSFALQHLINFEGRSTSPLPLKTLKKLSMGQKLDPADEEALSNWNLQLEKKRDQITSGELHQILKGYVSTFIEGASLQRLEKELIDRNCLFLAFSDPELETWKGKLKEGMQFEVSKLGRFTLGPPIPLSRSIDSATLAFSIEEHPEYMFVPSRYLAEFGIQEKFVATEHREHTTTLYASDPEGRFTLMERMRPWDEIAWDQEGDKIEHKIIAFMQRQLQQGKFYVHLDAQSWFLSQKEGSLKCTKRVRIHPHSFPLALHTFAVEISGANHARYLRLVTQSGLLERYDSPFQELLKGALNPNDPKNAFDALYNSCELTYPHIKEMGYGSTFFSIFYTEVQQRYRRLLKQLNSGIVTPDLESNLKQAMITVYGEQKGLGTFWETYDQVVLDRLTTVALRPDSRPLR